MYEEMNNSDNNTEYTYAQPEQQAAYQPEQPFQSAPMPEQQPVQPQAGVGFGVASLVLGILALVTFCTGCLNIPLAVLSIIFGIIQLVKRTGKGLAIGGLITSVLSIIAFIVFFMIIGMSIPKFSDLDDYSSFIDEYDQNNSYDYNDSYDYDDSYDDDTF